MRSHTVYVFREGLLRCIVIPSCFSISFPKGKTSVTSCLLLRVTKPVYKDVFSARKSLPPEEQVLYFKSFHPWKNPHSL